MEIIFAGGSHYETNGFESVKPYFEKIYVLDDHAEDIKPLMRESDELIKSFYDVDCKHAFLCGYARLISEEELSRKVFINVHGALLPKYRGMHPTFYAIMNGEKKLGITFHLVNPYMDSGDILTQYSFDYTGQTVAEINREIDLLVGDHAGETLYDFLEGRITPIPQNDSEAIFGAKRNLGDCVIDFNMSNILLRRFFKALTPNYPYPMLYIHGKRYEVLPQADIIDKDYFGPVGRVVFINEKGSWIKTKDGYLIVKKVREYGKDEPVELSTLVPIGYRFERLCGGGTERLAEIDGHIFGFFRDNVDKIPTRIRKFLAYFYPDARIRKQYLQEQNIHMGNNTFANLGLLTSVSDRAGVEIGDNVSIAPGVCFVTKSEPNNGKLLKVLPEIKNRLTKEKSIIVEDEVWIGANVTILPGVRIGRCSVIGAGSMVIDDVEEYSIYAGVPARKLKALSGI